jgi:hypothetical protein
MIPRFYHPLLTGLLPIALIACMNSGSTVAEPGVAVPLGTDLGGSGPVAPARASQAHPPPETETQMATKVITRCTAPAS